jgi:hypothetical protein
MNLQKSNWSADFADLRRWINKIGAPGPSPIGLAGDRLRPYELPRFNLRKSAKSADKMLLA